VKPRITTAAKMLRATFYAGGVIATAAGLATVIAGAKSLPAEEAANPVVESELRFYAAFYVAYGLAVLRVAPKPTMRLDRCGRWLVRSFWPVSQGQRRGRARENRIEHSRDCS
jgi:hypothetical protein